MLDENLPTFSIKAPSTGNPLSSPIFLRENGNEPQPEYTLRRPDPNLPASKNCYAVALYDSYNPDVLYAEVLVQPEWTQPTLSAAEVRTQNGVPQPPIPIVPEKFTIQLYNPDQQVVVRQIASTWNTSAYWEFEMPQNSFRVPSAAGIDRMANDPAAQDITPKIGFKWKKDGKLSRDISCYLAGRSADGKKNKEPDITVAMFKSKGDLTVYAPNMHRVDVEDNKGLEVVLILSAAVIKDIFFNANREMFNIGNPSVSNAPGTRRKNSGPVISGGTPPLMSGAVSAAAIPNRTHPVPASQLPPPRVPQPYAHSAIPPSGPPPTAADPRTQWEIDAETERLKKLVAKEEKEREKADREEQKRIKKMLEAEDKDRKKREAEVTKETERLKKLYGVPAQQNFPPPNQQQQNFQPPPQQFQPPPPQMPPRPQQQQQRPSPFPQFHSAPHSAPAPVQRPVSVGGMPAPGPTNCPTVNSWFSGPSAQLPQSYNFPGQVGGPYLQAPVQQSSGFFGLGGGKKVQKKRSVFF